MRKLYIFLAATFTLLVSASAYATSDCSTPTEITSCGTAIDFTIAPGQGNDNTGYCGFQNQGGEFYFTFTPTVTGNYFVSLPTTSAMAEFRYQFTSDNCASASWVCGGLLYSGGFSDPLSLIQGVSYKFCIDAQSVLGLTASIFVNCIPPTPANDNCVNAVSVSCGSAVTGTIAGATEDLDIPNCFTTSPALQGVWYKLVGDNHFTTVSLCGAGTTFDSRLAVYEGDCGALTCVTGNDDNGQCLQNGLSSQVSFQANDGITYYLFVHAFLNAENVGPFQLSVWCDEPCVTPANPNCATAINLGTIDSPTCLNNQVTGNRCAPANTVFPSCYSQFETNVGIWYSFQSSDSDIQITMNADAGADIGYGLYTGSCDNLNLVACNYNISSVGGGILSDLIPGTTYYLQLLSTQATAGNFSFCLTNPICYTPVGISLSNITENGATVTWNNLQLGTAVDLFYTTSPSLLPGETATYYGVTSPFYDIINLTEGTSYYVYLRSDCGIQTSEWVGPFTFQTHWTTPDCNTSPVLSCGNEINLHFEGHGSIDSNPCSNNAVGREFAFRFTPTLSGTYSFDFTNYDPQLQVTVQPFTTNCGLAGALCLSNNAGNFNTHLIAGTTYLFWLDRSDISTQDLTGVFRCTTVGEDPVNAFYINPTTYPQCAVTSGNLSNAIASVQSTVSLVNGADRYYRFTASTSGISILANSVDDILIELLSNDGPQFDSENLTTTGSEVLNATGLTVGATYYVGIRAVEALTSGAFTLCVRSLKPGACGNNPSFSFNLGQYFKAAFTSGATYRFDIHGTTGTGAGMNFIKNQSSPLLIWSTVVPTIPYGSQYNVTVSNVFAIANGAGQVELLTIPAITNCSVQINAQPLAVLRLSDRCAFTTKPRSSWIAANQFVLGASSWTWRFQKIDALGNNVGSAIAYTTPSSSYYLNIGLVSALEYGATYKVDVAPNFSYGQGAFGAQYTMCINTQVMVTEELQARQFHFDINENNLDVVVYPNPTDEVLNLASDEKITSVVLYNSNGQVVERFTPNQAGVIEISTQRLANGLYQMEVKSTDKRTLQRIIVSH